MILCVSEVDVVFGANGLDGCTSSLVNPSARAMEGASSSPTFKVEQTKFNRSNRIQGFCGTSASISAVLQDKDANIESATWRLVIKIGIGEPFPSNPIIQPNTGEFKNLNLQKPCPFSGTKMLAKRACGRKTALNCPADGTNRD